MKYLLLLLLLISGNSYAGSGSKYCTFKNDGSNKTVHWGGDNNIYEKCLTDNKQYYYKQELLCNASPKCVTERNERRTSNIILFFTVLTIMIISAVMLITSLP
jgi:hypothetical protein